MEVLSDIYLEKMRNMNWLQFLLAANLVSSLELGSNSRRGGRKKVEVVAGKRPLNIGLIVPFSNFLKKNYDKNIGSAVLSIKKRKYKWASRYFLTDSQVHVEMMSINPSPTGYILYIYLYIEMCHSVRNNSSQRASICGPTEP